MNKLLSLLATFMRVPRFTSRVVAWFVPRCGPRCASARTAFRRAAFGGLVLLTMAALPGCGGESEVQIADSPSSKYSQAWITVSEIAFHTAADPAVDDVGWISFPLAAPISVDLASLNNGQLADLLGKLNIPTGTYQSIRLSLVDAHDALTASAQSNGLTYNDQVNYFGADEAALTAPIELPPSGALIVSGSFKVAATGFSNKAPLDLALVFSSGRDLVRVALGENDAFILNPRLAGIDLSSVGKITGTVDLSTVTGAEVHVQAEALSSDSAYHAIVSSTTAGADGSFALYPLPAAKSGTTYDVVISGPAIATTIIKNVPVPGSSRAKSGATNLQAGAIALVPAGSFTTNVLSNQAVSPTGALLHFYQTISGTDGIPYEIAAGSLNPFTGRLADDLGLSAGDMYFATYAAGQDATFVSAVPAEGAGTYQVFADAERFLRSTASISIAANDGSAPVQFAAPSLVPDSPAQTSIAGTITQASAGLYDNGYLLATHNGSIVTGASLNAILAANGRTGGAFSLGNLPGGTAASVFAAGVYTVYAFVWSSSNPLGTLHRVDLFAPLDLTQGSASNVLITLN